MFGRRRRVSRPQDAEAASVADTPPLVPAPSPVVRTPLRPSRPDATVLGGRYELVRRLGEGGEASVFLARDLLLRREVAVKLFHGDVVPADRISQIETRVVAALNHYALTSLFDARIDRSDERGPRVFTVMEYVEGESLKQRLARGRMEVSEACWMGFDLAEGLDHLHQSGFLHRDVKPANVLISGLRSVRPVVAKLTDFGIAAVIGEPDFSEFTVGTAAYLSPEQVEGHDAGPASDIYSLGIVLLEAMTGRVEFPGAVEESAFERLVRDPRMPDDLPDSVADLLTRMTARRPEDRVDLHRVAVELQQFLADDLLRRRGETAEHAADAAATETATGTRDLVPEGRFDPVVRLAALAVDVPVVLLVVADGEDVRVASGVGWHGDGSELAALLDGMGEGAWSLTGRAGSSGAHGCGGDVAAMPVVLQDGRTAASLIARHPNGRRFGDVDLAALRDAAASIAQDVELRVAMRRVLFRAD